MFPQPQVIKGMHISNQKDPVKKISEIQNTLTSI